MKRIFKILSISLILTLCLEMTPVLAQSIDQITKNKEDITDIGNGIKLNSRVMGSGHATVIFDSGYNGRLTPSDTDPINFKDDFFDLQSTVAEYTRTIAYERTGIGKSTDVGNMKPLTKSQTDILMNGGMFNYNENEFTGLTKTPRDKAINLHKLLKAKNISAPYILVVHSAGGHTAIEFAKMYKEELEGVVFLDSTARNATGQGFEFFKKYMPKMLDGFYTQFSPVDGTIDEILMGENQVKHDENALRNIPILYLESDLGNLFGGDMGEGWKNLRKPQVSDILSLSNYADYKLVPGAGHYIHLDNPEVVKKAVMDFVYKVEAMK